MEMVDPTAKHRQPPRNRSSMGKRAWIRDGIGLSALLAFCCSEYLDTVVDVLSFTDAATHVGRRRFEMDRDLVLWDPLETVDLDEDGAEEVLFSSNEGLLWMRGDGTTKILWSGRDIIAAEWVEPTPRHGGRIVLLVVPLAGPPSLLIALSCASDRAPACVEESRPEVDDGASDIAAADLDEDGVTDVLTWGSDRVALLRGTVTADGRLAWPSRERFGDASTTDNESRPIQRLATGDLDEDGHVDVIVGQASTASEALVYFGDGLGGQDEAAVELAASGCILGSVFVGAVDGDARPDVVVACGKPVAFVSTGEREFEVSRPGADGMIEGDGSLLGRFGDDGTSSFFVWSHGEGSAQVIQRSEGSTWTPRTVSVPFDDAVELDGIVADLDGDGVDEIAFVSGIPDGC